MPTVNNIQKVMVDDMRNGKTAMPSNHAEVAQLMVELLLAVDHIENEKEFMDRCVSKAVRAYFSLLTDPKEGVYLSRIKNQMSGLNYFRTLSGMTGARGEDGFKVVYRHLISKGVASSDGVRLKMTDEARKFI